MTEEQARAHPWVLAGTHHVRRRYDGRPGGWRVRGKDSVRSCDAWYRASEKGRSASARYKASALGRITRVLTNMRYYDKRADARDEVLLQQLKERANR